MKNEHKPQSSKKFGATGIRARVRRITTVYANHYTIAPVHEWKVHYNNQYLAELAGCLSMHIFPTVLS